jgi:hypothetical protein
LRALELWLFAAPEAGFLALEDFLEEAAFAFG